jgi:hypothetical protein
MNALCCKTITCESLAEAGKDFCPACATRQLFTDEDAPTPDNLSLSERYPKYYKAVGDLEEIDVYAVHHLFQIQDPSGALQHASKKLLLSGVRTGGKSQFKDIKEARDTLTRWLQLNPEK